MANQVLLDTYKCESTKQLKQASSTIDVFNLNLVQHLAHRGNQ